MKGKLLLIFCVFLVSNLISQTVPQNFAKNYIDIKTPGTSDFIKYGNMNNTSYTGNLDLSIPIIEIPSKRINALQLSLRYDASGFRPSKRSGLVGLNWSINVGGSITRQINGMPDDQIGEPNVNGALKETNGFIVGVKNRIHPIPNVFTFNPANGFNSLNFDYYLNGTNIYNNYEGFADIFTFNFDGISGKFFMGNDGIIKVQTNSNNILSIDISGLQNQDIVNPNFDKPKNSQIIIKDEEGNKYFFGGETKNLEYNINSTNYPIIVTWQMYKVEYSNGNIRNFIFKDDTYLNSNFTSFDNVAIHSGFTSTNDYLKDFVQMTEYVSDESLGGINGASLRTTKQKISILEKIEDENYVLKFTYSRQAHIFNTRNSSSDLSLNNPSFFNDFIDIKLDNIALYQKNGNNVGGIVKNINLEYIYLGGTIHSRMFLNKITENGKQTYKFEYYPTGNLPKPITFGIDHWNFWNGNSDNYNNLVPYQNYQLNGDYFECSTPNCITRNPNFNFTLKGMLKKVIYPTKGYTSFEYEPNDYSKRLETRSMGNYVPMLYDVQNIGGGIRIKTITDFDGFSDVNVKNYEYKNDNNQSSGVLLSWPRYEMVYIYPNVGAADPFLRFVRNSPIGKNIMDIPIITYSQVTQKTSNIGKIVTNFTDFVSNPDEDSSNFYDHVLGANAFPKNLARNYIGYFLNDKSIERGKIKQERIYDNLGVLKQQIEFVYNIDPLKTNNYSTSLHLSGPSIQSNKLYHYNDYLTKKTTTSYNSTGNLLNIENSIYISNPSYNPLTMSNQEVLSKTSFTNSLNEVIEKEYKYPWQTYLDTSTEFLNFKLAHIITPIREISYKNGLKLNEEFTFFTKDATTNNFLMPKSVYSSKFPNGLININNIGNLEKKVDYDSYDNKGNVTQITQVSGVPTSLVWGYNQTELIAKLENVSYASINPTTLFSLLALSNADVDENTETSLINALNALRVTFPNAMITTYTYNPFVGVTTITDVKGEISFYKYDTNNRLIKIIDKNGNIVKENIYQYKN